jgi:hypothetical protein
MTNSKTTRITFRIDDRLNKFLNEFAAANKMKVSELCRDVITHFFMAYLLGEFKTSGLKERFMIKYGKKKKKVK